MAGIVKIYFDKEADFLEVLFSNAPGYMRETRHSDVMERVSPSGERLGFTVMNVTAHRSDSPLIAELKAD